MKKILCCFILIAFVVVKNKTLAQSANRSLSNLTSPTKINTDLLPDSNNTHNLGSAPRAWKNVYVGNAYFLMGSKFISAHGILNTFIGRDAGKSHTTGFENIAIGHHAMYQNTTGFTNIAIGNNALNNSKYCYMNIGIGDSALYKQTKDGVNIAIGYKALFNNDSGYLNTAVGLEAMYSSTYAKDNVAIGYHALYYNKTGTLNTVAGYEAFENSIGDFNTAFGAETYNNAGDDNSAFGYGAYISDGITNSTALGYGAAAYASNGVRIGNNSITSIGGWVDWNTTSDGRVKRNIKQNVPGLLFINKLQPVTYNLDLDAADKIIQRPQIKNKEGKIIRPIQSEIDARIAKQKIIYTGFIAQDVEKAAKSLNYDFSGVDAAKNDHDLYGLRYAEFVVPLVKAVQELSKMNDAKDSVISALKNNYDTKITDLQNQVNELKAMMLSHNISQPTTDSKLSTFLSASLEQNIPNPFSNTTTIGFTLPQQYSSAKVIITDKNGDALKQINLSDKGKGSVTVDASTLSSGAYQYSLIVDGKLIGSKQMLLTK